MDLRNQNAWGDRLSVTLRAPDPGPRAAHVGQFVAAGFDFPRLWVAYLYTEGLDRLLGDLGSLYFDVTIGTGRATNTQRIRDIRGFESGPLIFPATNVTVTAGYDGVVLGGPVGERVLAWAAFVTPWSWAGPETIGAPDAFPLLQRKKVAT